MKQYIKTITCIAATSFMFASCDNFLDEKPFSEVTNENYAGGSKSEAGKIENAHQLEDFLVGAYNTFASEFWQLDMYINNDSQSDNSYSGEAKDHPMQIDEYRVMATNGHVSRDWRYIYEQIGSANTILHWADSINDGDLTEVRRKEIKAEASFIRAQGYFNLIRVFGSGPITQYIPEIKVETLPEVYPLIYPKQATPEEIYELIISDLNYAIGNAPDYSTAKFRITKPLSNFLMALVLATKDGSASTNWSEVKKYASVVVNDGRYGLMPNFNDLFAVANPPANGVLPNTNLANEHCKESLFEVDYNSWSTLGNWGAGMFYGIDWKKFNTPSQDLYRAFNEENDAVRRDASIMFGDVTGKWTDKFWSSNKYPYCFKMRGQEAGNIILYRYAEAVLLLAEAENELGNTTVAQELLNRIRTRVQLPNTTAATKETLRLAIEKEHRLEFAFEGKRWFDLKRRGRAIQVMKSCADQQASYAKLRLSQEFLIWPIPQSELDKNNNLVQNPGY